MFTKDHVLIMENAYPPDGTKRVYLFSFIYGAKKGSMIELFNDPKFNSKFLIYANRGILDWSMFDLNNKEIFQVEGNRFSVYDVVRFMNSPEASPLFRQMIDKIFTKKN